MLRRLLMFAASVTLLTASSAFAATLLQTSPASAVPVQVPRANLDDAFQAAWGSTVVSHGPFTFMVGYSQLQAMGNDRYALVSTAYSNNEMGHHVEQALAVRYLVLTPAGYQATQAPVAIVSDATFGQVTWSVRDDLLDDPVLVAEFPSGGDRPSSPTNIGAYLIVLAPERPMVLSERIPLSCGLDRRFPQGERMKGELSASGDGLVVTYTGSHSATVSYAPNADGMFVAASDTTDLKWCGLL